MSTAPCRSPGHNRRRHFDRSSRPVACRLCLRRPVAWPSRSARRGPLPRPSCRSSSRRQKTLTAPRGPRAPARARRSAWASCLHQSRLASSCRQSRGSTQAPRPSCSRTGPATQTRRRHALHRCRARPKQTSWSRACPRAARPRRPSAPTASFHWLDQSTTRGTTRCGRRPAARRSSQTRGRPRPRPTTSRCQESPPSSEDSFRGQTPPAVWPTVPRPFPVALASGPSDRL